MIMQATKTQHIIINMVWGALGPRIFEKTNSPCIVNDEQTNQIFHQVTEYSN